MTLISLIEIIEIYSWIVMAIIMIFITAIAIFYEKKFGVRTFYYFYIFAIIVILAGTFEGFPYDRLYHESIELLGGASSLAASFILYLKMVGTK